MQNTGNVQKKQEVELISVKRNPYLAEYEEQRREQAAYRRAPGRTGDRRKTAGQRKVRRADSGSGAPGRESAADRERRQQAQEKYIAARERRRRQVRCQRIAVGLWMACIIFISSLFFFADKKVSATGQQNVENRQESVQGEPVQPPTEELVQGFPAAEFAKHPVWEENFLTPNEYSRPGEPLPEVKNVFVHYTANPGTSAAQNRSYFERQKDEHLASVSSHFIIGYEGEIVQCVPLDEIAYAVAGRNYDSVSIECCYKAADGSFTEETYDSLISLLAWLTDIYDLNTEDILRHYDAGGKKCPLYYTEHPDAWENLKEDVADALTKL